MVALNKTYLKPLTPDRSAKDSGLRFYSPEISRWLNRDPIGERGGLSLYGFCNNAPILWVDSLGHVVTTGNFEETVRWLNAARQERLQDEAELASLGELVSQDTYSGPHGPFTFTEYEYGLVGTGTSREPIGVGGADASATILPGSTFGVAIVNHIPQGGGGGPSVLQVLSGDRCVILSADELTIVVRARPRRWSCPPASRIEDHVLNSINAMIPAGTFPFTHELGCPEGQTCCPTGPTVPVLRVVGTFVGRVEFSWLGLLHIIIPSCQADIAVIAVAQLDCTEGRCEAEGQ